MHAIVFLSCINFNDFSIFFCSNTEFSIVIIIILLHDRKIERERIMELERIEDEKQLHTDLILFIEFEVVFFSFFSNMI